MHEPTHTHTNIKTNRNFNANTDEVKVHICAMIYTKCTHANITYILASWCHIRDKQCHSSPLVHTIMVYTWLVTTPALLPDILSPPPATKKWWKWAGHDQTYAGIDHRNIILFPQISFLERNSINKETGLCLGWMVWKAS